MGTVMKKEVYTTAQPDGTLLTTTTTTETKAYHDQEFEFLGHPMNVDYCCTPAAIVRILQIICGLIVVALITSVYGTGPFIGVLLGQTLLLIVTCISLCLTFIILIALFLGLHNGHLSFFPWRSLCLIFSIVAGALFLILGILEIYYATGSWATNCNAVDTDGVIHSGCRSIIEWGFAAAFCFLLALLYFVTAFLAYGKKYFD